MNRRLFFFPCYVLTAGALFLFNRNLAEAAKGAPRKKKKRRGLFLWRRRSDHQSWMRR